ncbi:hypothetical protein GCM10025791_07670 [Halioxenophilus aromaticivorans]|uniref:Sulfotransferase n=1 Tax=Halioxenophilus aromaticivorans TaxID=1306992 RepID=A0AAV3TY73_9ALTE
MLVLGASRGGTTIVTAALGSHPEVAMLDEEFTGAVFHVTGGKIRGNKLCVPNQLEWSKRYHRCYKILGVNGFLRKRKLWNLIPRSELSLMDYVARGPVQSVCILREPNAVISSIIQRERRSANIAAFRWQRCVEFIAQIHDQHGQHDNLLPPAIVSFEGLVQSPEETLKRLCQFINLPYAPAMMNAPSRNARYAGSGFDASKIQPSSAINFESLLSTATLETYQRLLVQDLSLPQS